MFQIIKFHAFVKKRFKLYPFDQTAVMPGELNGFFVLLKIFMSIYHLAKGLALFMEELLVPCFLRRSGFKNFKSTICHRVKEIADIDFIIDLIEKRKALPESSRTFIENGMEMGNLKNCITR